MGKGKILMAKGDDIELELVEGKETFQLGPLTNEQLLEIQDIAADAQKKDEKEQGKSAMESLVLLAVHSLNNGLPIDIKEEEKFTLEQMKKSSTPILLELFDKAVKINKLEKMFAFQQKSQIPGSPTLSAPGLGINTLADLKNNPRAKLG